MDPDSKPAACSCGHKVVTMMFRRVPLHLFRSQIEFEKRMIIRQIFSARSGSIAVSVVKSKTSDEPKHLGMQLRQDRGQGYTGRLLRCIGIGHKKALFAEKTSKCHNRHKYMQPYEEYISA